MSNSESFRQLPPNPNHQHSSSREDSIGDEKNFKTQLVINLSHRSPRRQASKDQEKQPGEKRISFFVDNHPERVLIREPKVIKLKITLPKGYLHDAEVQKRNSETSCKLTQTDYCLIDDMIDGNGSSPRQSLINGTSFENYFIPPYKSSLIETNKSKASFISVEETDNLINGKSLNYPPIMGKSALLAKIQATKTRLSDSEIIRLLVEERFHKFLQDYYERSFKRAQRHSTLLDDEVDEPSHTPGMDDGNEPFRTPGVDDGNEPYRTPGVDDGNEPCLTPAVDDGNEVVLQNHLETSRLKSDSGTSSKSSLNTSSVCTTENSELFELTSTQENGNQECFEYDDKAFLRDALGEDGDIGDSCEGLFNATLNDTNSTFHFGHSPGNKASGDRSIGTSELSALLSKASSLYSSISKRMRRSATSIFRQTPIGEERIRTSNVEEDCLSLSSEKLSELAREAAVQHQILLQTSKALNFCKNTKEFISSREQVEAERILLAAACKRELLMKELTRRQFDGGDLTESKKTSGTVTISRLKFTAAAKPDLLNQLQTQRRTKEFLRWSVCVASCGLKLSASEAVLPEEDGSICFLANTFEFDGLPPDFEIHLALYSMRIKNNVRNYSHESKFHLNQDEKSSNCPSPQKIILNMHKDKNRARSKEEPLIRTSSFTLWGRTVLRIADLSRTRPLLRLSGVPLSSNLDGTLTMSIASQVKLNERYSGFLNIGSESGGSIIWNRRWCALFGQEMKYWNYPCEENSTEPIAVLNLSRCANSTVSLADRVLCPRSKTLLLEIVSVSSDPERKYDMTRHFLNADTLEDVRNWENCLNAVVASLRNWNAAETKNIFSKNTL